MSFWFSTGIRIRDAKRGQGHLPAPLSMGEATNFIAETREWLRAIENTTTGGEMIREINASGHVVDIYRTWDFDDGNAQGGGGAGEFVKPLDTVRPDGTHELGHLLAFACQDLSGRSKLERFFKIGKARPRFLKRDALARLCGTNERELKEMAAGTRAIPKLVDDKLRVYLYDFLQPGAGEDCWIKFNPMKENLSDEHKKYLPQSHHWAHRPPGIALAHELVHAWRVVSGRVMFAYGWEEEAMTVGLPPFSNMKFTENRIRIDWVNLAVRPDYLHIGVKSAIIAAADKIGMDKGGNRAWQGKSGALHPQQDLAQAMSARRKAMGYEDD